VIGLREFEQYIFRTQPEGARSGPGDLDLVVYCHAPESRVLTADLEWRRIDSLRSGQRLVTFDEQDPTRDRHRHFSTGTVTGTQTRTMDRCRVVTSAGSTVVTPGHLFLVRHASKPRTRWVRADRLRLGDAVYHLPTWSEDRTWEAGVTVRPPRLLRHPELPRLWEQQSLQVCDRAYVQAVETLPAGPMVAMETSTRTYVADGLLTHNSLRKWTRLAMQGNPTVLLPLFVPDEHVVVSSELGRELRAMAGAIVSRQAAPRFLGYLAAQRDKLLRRRSGAGRPELIERYGFDCYLDDTEFLTDRGWLRYDDIADGEAVGTIHPLTGEVEFQVPSERVAKPYTGPIVKFRHRYTEAAVTPNHRMWVSPTNRGPSGVLGTGYRPEAAKWGFRRADELRKGFFHVRVSGTPRDVDYPVADADLALVGAYVSEGCVAKHRLDGSASVLAFDQLEHGRLEPVMAAVGTAYPMRTFRYAHRERSDGRTYVKWTLAHRAVAARVALECGEKSQNKRLPRWAFHLSGRQADLLLDALMAGDGTRTRLGYRVYYTISCQLAGDVQALALLAGRRANVWGPYPPGGMYQVMVHHGGAPFTALAARTNIRTEPSTGRIVCFTVPNETLITRRNGRVAMHGNTKFAMHMVRLGVQGVELLETGRITLPMPEPWLSWCRALRRGERSEREALEAAAELELRLRALETTSPLPPAPDRERLDAWLVAAHQRAWADGSLLGVPR
jgi:hypothetical protein